MSKLEIYRAALSQAVRDGQTELVKILTRECFALIDSRKRPQIVDVLRFGVGKRQVEGQ